MDVNQPMKGMNMDAHPSNLDGAKAYTFALNARQESEDGNEFNMTNEPTTTLAVNFPVGCKVIGTMNVVEMGWTVYWLTNPSTGHCEIGYVSNSTEGCWDTLNNTNPPDTGSPVYSEPSELSTVPCMAYTMLMEGDCLNFSLAHPVVDAVYKRTNKTTEFYWTDNYNPPRWFDVNKIPIISGALDCNLLSIFPDFRVPNIEVTETQDTGSLAVGSYQILVAYANSVGAELSQYYSVTDPCPIWENKNSDTLSFPTSKAIKMIITNLDTQYTYINVAIVKTINYTETFELAATLSFTSPTLTWVYSGNNKTALPLTREQIYFRAPYYATAETMTTQNRLLMMANLVTEPRLNYQPIASALEVMWETYAIPYTRFEAYNSAANATNTRGYMRDEVYTLDMVVIEKNGRVSDRFPIPGRIADSVDLTIITNEDANNIQHDPCSPAGVVYNWQVYNTGSLLGLDPNYVPGYNCPQPYQYGRMGYWESSELYPNNPTIWGPLANTPIRHHKFPDSTITHIHDGNPGSDIGYVHTIYPIGFKFDLQNIQQAIANSGLTSEQQANIAAIRILRGNRRNDKSVQAKGIIYNVGSYTFQGQPTMFPNYPFNDTHPDVYLSTEALDPISGMYTSAAPPYSGQAISHRLNAFTGADQARFTFLSPDTSFITPSLSGQLRLETIEYGKSNAHIVSVLNNPRYEIGTQNGIKMAVVMALSTILSEKINLTVGDVFGISAGLDISLANFLPAFTQALDLISKLIPFEQYGYQFNSVGNYCNYIPVPNNGSKVRTMITVGYVNPGIETIPGEQAPLNNFQRESSVFLETSTTLPYPWDYPGIPRDNSRFTFGSYLAETGINLAAGQRVFRDISAYYASLKRVIPDQYGEIHSYVSLDTGFTLPLDGSPLPIVFGGDTFINRFAVKRKLPFFISNTCGEPDNTDIDYSQLGNVSYPTYYLSTGPEDPRISSTTLALFNDAYAVFAYLSSFAGTVISAVTGTGVIVALADFVIVMAALFSLMNDIISVLGIKKVNLDRLVDSGYFLQGIMYLFAYGIPYYFVESDFNCDYRQPLNDLEGNFFPNVGTDIPDYWLQEGHVSISRPEEFIYNRDLSKQNLDDVYTWLPENWSPTDNSYVHTTRVIYSEPYNIEEQQNNWLLYRPNNYYDFTYNNGPVTSLKAIEQDKVLVLFENNFSVYNAYITLETNIKDAISGSGNMFANPPQEYSRTNIGYAGAQHHAFTSTPFGHFWVDAKRGCIFQMTGEGPKDIARAGMMNWFKENLPFQILRTFPDYPIDNAYNGAGITVVWDNRFNRLFVTKRDFVPLTEMTYEDGFFVTSTETTDVVVNRTPVEGKICCPDGYTYIEKANVCLRRDPRDVVPPIPCTEVVPTTTTTKTQVFPSDPKYFCDASWTVAYSPMTQSWVSFYSFHPNYYVEQQEFFQSGIQDNDATLWNHLMTNKSYQTFYNEFHNFEIESVTKPEASSGVLTAINYRMDIYRYENQYDWRFMKDITFDKAILYSTTQTSGELDMHVQHKNNMYDGIFAVQNLSSISIPISSLDNLWRFNKFSDVTKDANSLLPLFNYTCSNVIKELNDEALDYSKPFNMLRKQRLKSDWFKVKLINSTEARYKFIFKWLGSKVVQMLR